MNELLMLGSVPAVTVIVQGIKTGLAIEGRWAFVLSLLSGVTLSFLMQGYRGSVDPVFEINVWAAAVEGLLAGLGASGLYAGVTTSAGSLGRPADPGEDVIRNN